MIGREKEKHSTWTATLSHHPIVRIGILVVVAAMVLMSCGDDDCCAVDARVAGDGEVACAADAAFEPNDSVATAFLAGTTDFVEASLAICPGNDRDYYEVTITTAPRNLELLLHSGADGPELLAVIVDPNGSPIEYARPTLMENEARAYAPNLAAGTYYALVYGATAIVQNNYSLALHITAP